MARRYYSSTAVPTTLLAGITDSGTTLTLSASTGFPTTYPFTLILDEDTAYEEVVTVTALLGANTFTIVRGTNNYNGDGTPGGDGTTPQEHNAGAAARHGFSKRDLDEPNAHIAASAAVHGLTGTVVGTSDTQTLTNKTLTSPTISGTPTITGAVTFSDDVTVSTGAAAARVIVSTNAGVTAQYYWKTGSTSRWVMRKSSDAESGSDAGSNLELLRLDDTGTVTMTVWTINRATGATTYTGAVTFADVTFAEAKNIALGTTTGTKIGTSTSQKLAFYNSTPIVKPSGSIITALSNLGLVASPTLASTALSDTADIAYLTSSQTLTNKTLTTPTIASFTNATHNHSNAAEGGTIAASSLTGVTGTVVGTSQTQTLTNKTIDGDSNTLTDVSVDSIKHEAWDSYTPTLTGWTGGTPTITGNYVRIGNTVHFKGSVTNLSGMSLSSTPTITLPPSLTHIGGETETINVLCTDVGSGNYAGQGYIAGAATTAVLHGLGTSGAYTSLTTSFPFTWAATDVLSWNGTYETSAA